MLNKTTRKVKPLPKQSTLVWQLELILVLLPSFWLIHQYLVLGSFRMVSNSVILDGPHTLSLSCN